MVESIVLACLVVLIILVYSIAILAIIPFTLIVLVLGLIGGLMRCIINILCSPVFWYIVLGLLIGLILL